MSQETSTLETIENPSRAQGVIEAQLGKVSDALGILLSTTKTGTQAQRREAIASLEAAMLELPQVEQPLKHHFTPGVYCRELSSPKGSLIVTKLHREPNLTLFLKGKLGVITEHGMETIEAPLMFETKPGTKRVWYAQEDVVWCTCHPNPEELRDIDALESRIIAPDFATLETEGAIPRLESLEAEPMSLDQENATALFPVLTMAPEEVKANQEDYARFLEEIGYTFPEAAEGTRRTDDFRPLPLALLGVRLSASPLGGLGVFAVDGFDAGTLIGPARVEDMRTQLGRYTNHSPSPNAIFRARPNGDIDLFALRRIEREEILADYRNSLTLPGVRQPKRLEQ